MPVPVCNWLAQVQGSVALAAISVPGHTRIYWTAQLESTGVSCECCHWGLGEELLWEQGQLVQAAHREGHTGTGAHQTWTLGCYIAVYAAKQLASQLPLGEMASEVYISPTGERISTSHGQNKVSASAIEILSRSNFSRGFAYEWYWLPVVDY